MRDIDRFPEFTGLLAITEIFFYQSTTAMPSRWNGILLPVLCRHQRERVAFERGLRASMMGIDGTWRRNCLIEDVSESSARLTVQGSVDGLNLKEFFLLLLSTGLAYRRCELSWVNGDQIGVGFLKQSDRKKKAETGTGASRPR